MDNVFNGVKNVNHDSVKGARLSLRVKFTDDLDTTLSGLVQDIDNFGLNLVYLNPKTLRPALGKFAYSSPFNQASSVENRSVSDTTTLNLHFATLTNVATYANVVGNYEFDYSSFAAFSGPGFTPLPPGFFVHAPDTFKSGRFSDEIRLVSSPGQFEWLLGGFYTDERDPDYVAFRGTDSAGVTLPPSSPYYNVYTYSNTSYFKEKAIFGDLTYHLSDRLEGTVGTRYSSNDQSFRYTNSGNLVGGVPGEFGGDSSDSAETYLATVIYKPAAEMSVYLRAASAYRPGGPNILNPATAAAGAPASFEPDKLWSYEAGMKGSLWNHRITYSADIFQMDWKNIQVGVFYGPALVVANASSAKSKGIETSWELAIDGLTVSLNGAYTDAKLTSDMPAPANGASGDRLPYSPEFAAAAVVDYRMIPFSGIAPRAGLTYAYRSSENTAFATGVSYKLPSYNTLDVRGGFDWSRYSLMARIDNVTNRYALTGAASTAAPGSPLGGIVIKPRTFGVSLQARF